MTNGPNLVSVAGRCKLGQRGSVLAALLSVAFVILLASVCVFYVFGQIVPPNYIGIRRNSFSLPMFGPKGYQSVGLKPGLHLKIPGLSSVLLIPRDFQFVHWNSSDIGGNLRLGVLNIPTDDGSKVNTDVTLILRYFDKPEVVPGEKGDAPSDETENHDRVPFTSHRPRTHGGPRELIATYKDEQNLQLRTISQVAEGILKQRLGRLATTDYYNPVIRETAALEALESINREVNANGVEAWAVLIRRYVYADKNIDDQIFAKNLQEATERLNSEAAKLAKAQAITERTRADWDANRIGVLEQEGAAEVRVLRSEGDLYEGKQIALGDRVVAEARAGVDKAKAGLLARMPGAEVYIARELTSILTTLKGGVVSNIDPFDISGWVERLQGERRNRQPPPSAPRQGSDEP